MDLDNNTKIYKLDKFNESDEGDKKNLFEKTLIDNDDLSHSDDSLHNKINNLAEEKKILKEDLGSLRDRCEGYEKTISQIDTGYNKNCDMINNLTNEVRILNQENKSLKIKYHLDTIKWRTYMLLMIFVGFFTYIYYLLRNTDFIDFDNIVICFIDKVWDMFI